MYLGRRKFITFWPSCLLVLMFLGQVAGNNGKIDIGPLPIGIAALSAITLVALQIWNKKFFQVFQFFPTALFFTGFITLTLIGSIFSDQPGEAVLQSIRLTFYFCVSIAVAGLDFEDQPADGLITIFLGLLVLVLILSIISFYGNLLPTVFNTDMSSTLFLGLDRPQLTATYDSRTMLNSYLVLAFGLASGLLASGNESNRKRVLLAGFLIVILISASLTYSRGVFWGFFPVLIFLVYRFFISQFRHVNTRLNDLGMFLPKLNTATAQSKFLFITVASLIFSFLSFVSLAWVFELTVNRSDGLRLEYFLVVLHDLNNNLFGQGIVNRYFSFFGMYKNSHNNFVLFLDASGYFGVAFLLIFFAHILVRARESFSDPIVKAVSLGLLCNLFFGMAHVTYSNLTLWIIFGILLQRLRMLDNRQVAAPRGALDA